MNASRTQKKISVLILTYCSEKEIQACVDAVLLGATDDVEVILLDNVSPDGTWNLINQLYGTHPLVRLVKNSENVGFARGINQLAAMATGEHLLILNPDTVAPYKAYAELSQYLDETVEVGVVGPRITDEYGMIQESYGYDLTPYNELVGKVIRSKYAEKIPVIKWVNKKSLERGTVQEVGWIGGACIMVRKSLFDELGGLDTHFFLSHGDMVDFGMRVKRAGHKIILYPLVSIIHTGSKSVAHDRDRALYEAYDGTLYFFKKHYESHVVFLVKCVYVVTSFAKALVAGIISLVKRNPYRAIAHAHGKNAWLIMVGKLK